MNMMTPRREFGRKDGSDAPTNETDLKELGQKLKTATDEVKRFAEDADKAIKEGRELTEKAKGDADKALTELAGIRGQIEQLEQKLARSGSDDDRAFKSLGMMVTEGNEDAIRALDTKRGRFAVDVKAIISALTTDADGSAGDMIVPQRQPGVITPPQRRMTIRGLLTPGATTSNAIQYVKETGFTNSAATVSETAGSAKPQSELKFDLATGNVTTIAHWVLATKQILDDVPMLQSYIDGRLRYGLAYVEEQQLLNGDGTGTNLNGIYTQATAFSPAFTLEAPTHIDVLRLALLQAELAELPSSGIVLNPIDWAQIELTKTTEGAYLFANPQAITGPVLWGRPVVPTQAMTADKFLTGAFQMGAQIFDRQEATVEISTEDSDNFRKNLVTVRAEERLALAVYRPEAFIKGDFSDAITASTAA